MVEFLTLSVERREEVGKRRNRRLRESGKTPAVLYGHKKEVVNLTVPAEQIDAAIRLGNRFVNLSGAVNERAFIKEVQWNTWGDMVLHVDFTRVSENERVQVELPLEIRGEAPGVKEGGVVKQVLYRLEVEADPTNAPERISVGVNELGFNQQIRVADLVLPEGVKALTAADAVVVECSEQEEVSETAEEAVEGAEPELIGRKKADEEEAE
jgi:large subunit ribosomal protein L25